MVEVITSLQNKMIKDLAKLTEKKYRHQAGLFLLEGIKLVQEVLDSSWNIEYILIDQQLSLPPTFIERAQQRSKKLYYVTTEIIGKISDVQSAQGIVAVSHMANHQTANSTFDKHSLLLVLEDIQDPGNMGTIIRTAVATGVSSIIVTPECVDIYSPKVVRASMGGLLRIPILNMDIAQAFEYLHSNKFDIHATALHNADSLYTRDLSNKLAIVLGNEANGVSEYVLANTSRRLFIPQIGQIESLNVSVAASVIMYETLRQKLCLGLYETFNI